MIHQESYLRLCVKFFLKEISDEEITQLNEWLNASEDNRNYFNQVSKLWYADQHNRIDVDNAWLKMKNRMGGESPKSSVNTISFTKKRFYALAGAALFLILISLPIVFYTLKTNGAFRDEVLFEVSAPKGEKAAITLVDGTKVWLNSGSILKYSSAFDLKHRIVFLEGEGYFEVTKDKSNNFTVVCGKTEVIVYGTVFNISNYQEDGFIQLTLVSGKLGFNYSESEELAILSPSEQLTYSRKTEAVTIETIDTELYTVWKENLLKFDNAPFLDVMKKMERWYDVEITLDDKVQNLENYTMTLKTESLKEILEMIKLTTAIDYTIDKENIYIYNKSNF